MRSYYGPMLGRRAGVDLNRSLTAPDRLVLLLEPLGYASMHAYRTHTCGELRSAHVGETVRVSGWVHRKRDHGGVLFVDLRDHYGLVQIVADSDSEALKTLERSEER